MFNSIIGDELTIISFLICMGVAFVLGIVVSIVHMLCVRTNKNFAVTLAVLPLLVTVVILLVNGNLGTSVAIVGAFSLIRFRSIPGNSRELMYVFFAMVIGLAVGTGYIAFAAIFTLIGAVATLLLSKINFTFLTESNKVLTILVPEDLDYTNMFDEEFKSYLSSYELIKTKTTNLGSMYELTYQVKVKSGANEKEFIDKLRVKNGNLKIILSHPMMEAEL